MGCATSKQTLSTEAVDEQGPASESAGKKKGKSISIKVNSDNFEQKPKEQKSDQHETMKIRVIWRRVSIFGGGRRDSGKSKANSDIELPGPSEYFPAPQAKSPQI
uniref:Uncharacterized protein n=1 Tax=Sphaerodactylus townsendi TaxID=933632 RepID=A0ACB8G7J0_9SAUR